MEPGSWNYGFAWWPLKIAGGTIWLQHYAWRTLAEHEHEDQWGRDWHSFEEWYVRGNTHPCYAMAFRFTHKGEWGRISRNWLWQAPDQSALKYGWRKSAQTKEPAP